MAKQERLIPSAGQLAPEFSAEAPGGGRVSLAELRGRPVVLFFYPRDNTPGCTIEACAFRDRHGEFLKLGAVVIGVSTDTVLSHERFAARFSLPFELAADPERRVVAAYGAWGVKNFLGKKYEGTHRMTFLIDGGGRIARVWPRVKPLGHAAEVLEAVRALPGAAGLT